MLALSHADFLAMWEAGQRRHPLDRVLLAIRASLPADAREGAVADWPLGRRNRALAALRTLYFGPRLEGWTACLGCGEKLEFELDCRSLVDTPVPAADLRILLDGSSFRLLTSRDLAGIANETDPAEAAIRLLEGCAVGLEGEGEASGAEIRGWPAEKIDAVAEMMVQADPLAEVSLGLECPLCHHASEETLDLGGFVWTEIEARARRLLSEVHVLAAAYSWAEFGDPGAERCAPRCLCSVGAGLSNFLQRVAATVAPGLAGAAPRLHPMMGSIFAPAVPLAHFEAPPAGWSPAAASVSSAPAAPAIAVGTQANPVAYRQPPPAETVSVVRAIAPELATPSVPPDATERDLLPGGQVGWPEREICRVRCRSGICDRVSRVGCRSRICRCCRVAMLRVPRKPMALSARCWRNHWHARLAMLAMVPCCRRCRRRGARRHHGGSGCPHATRCADPSCSRLRKPQAQQEPDEIHIHIGRIEVAAIAAPAPRPAPVRKALSLDEYLRRGNGRQG